MNEDPDRPTGDIDQRIRELAYLMWESAGRQVGNALEYWLQAEREVHAAVEATAERLLTPDAEVPAAAAAGRTAYRIEAIEGIGPVHAATLATAGMVTTGDLLERCGSAAGRRQIAEQVGIGASQLRKWVGMADLMRISGVGGEYAELLAAAGIGSVTALAATDAEALTARMAAVNAERKLTRRVASAGQVATWVEQASVLEPRLTD